RIPLPYLQMRARNAALATVRAERIHGGGTALDNGLGSPGSCRAPLRDRGPDSTSFPRPLLDTSSRKPAYRDALAESISPDCPAGVVGMSGGVDSGHASRYAGRWPATRDEGFCFWAENTPR